MNKLLSLAGFCLLLSACGSSDSDSDSSSSSSSNNTNTGTGYVTNLKFDADALESRTLYDLYDNSATTPTNYFPFYITLDDELNAQIGDGFNPDYETDYSEFTYAVNTDGYLEISTSSKAGIIKPIEMIDELSVITEYCDLDDNDVESNCETGYLFDSQADAESYINTNATSKTAIDTSGLVSKISNALEDKEYSYTEQVRSIDGSDSEITDISFVSDYLYLEELDLDDNSITDLTEIANLTQIDILSLGSNSISDIAALNNLTSITSLDLSFQNNDDGMVNISDYDSLYTLTNIEALFIDEYGDTESAAAFSLNTLINSINDKDQLTDLYLESVRLDDTDMADIVGVNNLETIVLYDDGITDFSDLTQNNSWSNLEDIALVSSHTDQALFSLDDMINNNLEISKLTNLDLQNITFDDNDLITLTGGSLSNLEGLILVDTDITDFSPLAETSLETIEWLILGNRNETTPLNLDFSNISSIAETIYGLYLTDFDTISNFSLEGSNALKYLDLENSNITGMTADTFNTEVLKANNLESLYLTGFQLDSGNVVCTDLALLETTSCYN